MRDTSWFISVALGLAVAAAPGPGRAAGLLHAVSIYADGDDKPLSRPEGVACSDAGDVVVSDTGNGRLVRYAFRDGVFSAGKEIKVPQVTSPTRAQHDSKGNLLVLDTRKKRVARLDAKGAFLGTVEPKDGATVIAATFTVDRADNVYLLDLASGRVLVVDGAGEVARRIEVPKSGAAFMDLAVDAAGTLYAVDGVGASVWVADKTAAAFKPLTKSLRDVMNFPASIVANNRGTLLLLDRNGNGLVTLGIDGSFRGRQLAIGWTEGLVYYPSQLCVTSTGETFIADRANNRVQVFTTGG